MPAPNQRMLTMMALLGLLLPLRAVSQNNPEGVLKEAISLHQAGDIERAIVQYRAYLKVRPDAVEARSNLAVALAKTGRYSEAIAEYREALKRRPLDPRIRLNYALALYKAGQIHEAAGELAALHAKDPAERQVLLLLADCRLRLGEHRAVIELLAPVEAASKDDLAVAYLLGTALLRDKQVVRGQRIINRILQTGDSAESRLLVGTARFEADEFEAAVADLRKAAELNPALPDVHSYLGRAYVQTGDAAAAESEFRKELELNPNDFESNLQLGVLLKRSQDFAASRRLLARGLSLRPGDFRTRYQIAAVDLAEGKLNESRAGFESILKEAPRFIEARVSLATVYYRLGRRADGDREKAQAQKLTQEEQAKKNRRDPAQ